MMKHHSFIHSQAKRERRAQLNNERSKVEGLSMLANSALMESMHHAAFFVSLTSNVNKPHQKTSCGKDFMERTG